MAQDPYKYFRVEARELVDQFAQGRPRAREGRGQRGCRAAAAAPRAHAQGRRARRQAVGDRRPRARDRGCAVAVPRARRGIAREQIDAHPRASRRHQRQLGRRWRRPRLAARPGPRKSRAPKPEPDDGLRTRSRRRRRDAMPCSTASPKTHALAQRPARQPPQAVGAGARIWRSCCRAQLVAAHGRRTAGNPAARQPPPRAGRGAAPQVRRHRAAVLARPSIRWIASCARCATRRSACGWSRPAASSRRSSGPRATRRARSASAWRSRASGGDIRLDAHVLETVQGALIQIVRNAVAHGIEPESERAAAGKPAVGRGIRRRRAPRAAHRVRVPRRRPRRRPRGRAPGRRATRHARPGRPRELDAEELVRLLLRGGISTSTTVTEVSGRGIGLDVVREAVERLGGEVVVRDQPGRGTTIELVVPLSLASVEALIVEAEGAGGVTTTSHSARRRPQHAAHCRRARSRAAAPVHRSCTSRRPCPSFRWRRRSTARPGRRPRSWTAVIVVGAEGHRGRRRRPPARHRPHRRAAAARTTSRQPDRGGRVARRRRQPAAGARSRRARRRRPARRARPSSTRGPSATAHPRHRRFADHAHAGAEHPRVGRLRGRRRRVGRGGARDRSGASATRCSSSTSRCRAWTASPSSSASAPIRRCATSRPSSSPRGRRPRTASAAATSARTGYIVKSEFDQAELLAMIRTAGER